MKSTFKNISFTRFEELFATEVQCYEFLASEKWKNGFNCLKCGNTNYCKGKKPYSRRCTRCKSEESATAHTAFHKCKIPITEAFRITYMICHNPDISSYKLSENFNIRPMTCWKLKKKIMECIDQRGDLNLIEKQAIKKKLSV